MNTHNIHTKYIARLLLALMIFHSFVLFPSVTLAQESPAPTETVTPTPSPTTALPAASPNPTPTGVADLPNPSDTPIPEETLMIDNTNIDQKNLTANTPPSPSSLINNLAETNNHEVESSSKLRRRTKIKGMSKHLYRANEVITLDVEQDSENTFNATLVDKDGERTELEFVEHLKNNSVGTMSIIPPRELTPGEYTIEIKDSAGVTQSFDILWGVLAINTNKSMYSPGETAQLAIAVLDEKGEMVCDADVSLQIKNPKGEIKTLTSTDGIHVTDVCTKKIFTMEPDYKAEYPTTESGKYEMTLTAKTKNGTNTINDMFEVDDSIAFDVERSAPTRTYPVYAYPVTLTVTAKEDFKGEIKDIVPFGFDISAPKERDGQPAPTRYDRVDIIEHETPLDEGKVLGESTTNVEIRKPFDGDHAITLGFGEGYHDENLVKAITDRLTFRGHEGVDFDMPVGTPIFAAADGEVLIAGKNDYGLTVVIKHPWGRTYYGHLSEIAVKEGEHVTGGTLIGKSGNSGDSTGPHLHFGLKLDGADETNGYGGMSDPLVYLPSIKQKVLGTTTISNNKVKEIVWSVDIKKGDTIRLGYEFISPPDSPRFYLLGEARFEIQQEDKTSKVLFAEKRKWQVAVDAPNGSGMLAYDEDAANNTPPHYRTWSSGDLSSEGDMQDEESTTEEANHTKIKAAPTRDEYIRAALTSAGHLDVQVWSGGTWIDGGNAPTNGEFTTGIGTTNDAFRGFDVAYESSTGDGLVVYESTSTANKTLKYRTWDGSNWSAEGTLDYSTVAEGGANDVTVWVELDSNPSTDSILLGWQDKTGLGYYGARWDGSTFQNISLINGAGVSIARQGFDLAWEGSSGDGMIAYTTGTTTDFSTYTTSGGFVDGSGSVNIGGAGVWLRLAGDVNSDYIAMITVDTLSTTSADVNVDMWNGSDWTSVSTPTEDTDINTYGFSQGVDVTWEISSSDQALFVWRDGTTSETSLRYMIYDISAGQFQAPCQSNQQVTSLSAAQGSNGPCSSLGTWAGTVSGITLQADPSSTNVMLVAQNGTSLDIRPESQLWDGSTNTWSQTSNMGGFEIDASTGVLPSASLPSMPYDFAYNKYTPTITISGTCDQYDETTDCSDDGSNEIKVAYNGTVQSTVDTTVDGSWSITGIAAPSSGQVVTIFINGESTASERAVAVTKYDGSGDITGIKLFQRHLVLGSDDNPTLSNTNLSQYDSSVSSDSDIFFEVDSNDDLTVDTSSAYTDEKLYVLSGTTYQPGTGNSSNVSTHDYINVGTTDITANTMTVSGSWTQSGTFSDTCSGTTTGTNASLVNFTSTSTGETVSGTINGTSDFCKVNFNGSGGEWTIQNAMKVSSADATDTFTVSAGTVTLGDGNGDNLDVRGKFTVSGGTFQTLSSLALGSTITIDINTSGGGGSGGCAAGSSNCSVAISSGTMTINKNATIMFNTTNTSTSSLTSGVDISSTGTLNVTGALDDTGTDTGTDSLSLRETKICANKSWTSSSLNNDYVQMTSGFARGKMYPITGTAASDASSCLVDTDDSITRADTSTADTTIQAITNNTTNYKICSASNTQITASGRGVGSYLRDLTGTTGYYLIIKSTNNDATCASSTDSFVVIPDPDNPDTLSNMVVSDSMDISDGVKSGDTFNIVDMATFSGLSTGVSDFTKHAYINNTSANGSINIQYAFVNHLGIEGAAKYGINADTGTMNYASAGKFYVANSYLANFRRAIRCSTCSNAITAYGSGFYNNYFEGVTGSTASTLPYECIELSTGRNNEAAGNRCEKTYGDGNWGAFGSYTGNTNIYRDNIAISADSASGATIRSEVKSNNLYLNNRFFRGGRGIEDVGGASAHQSVLAGNMIFGTSSQAVILGTATQTQKWHLAGNTIDNATVNLDIVGSPATIIAYGETYGKYTGASTADVRYNGTGTTKANFYNSLFGSSTETSGISTTNMYLISKMHDQTSGATAIWKNYTIPSDNAETPRDESTQKFNYSNNSWEDSFTPHLYLGGTGTEDSSLDFAFSGGTLGGSESYYVYRVVCEVATCTTGLADAWTVYRTGVSGQTSPSKFASVGTAVSGTTYTDSTTNVQFKIDNGASPHVRSDTYTFMVYRNAADSSNQKTITMMQTNDSFTVSSGTLQLLGSTSSTPTTIQKAAAATSYDFTVSGGTINANQYKFTGQGVSGLNLASGTITDLSNGTFDDHANTAADTYMTVTAALLNSTGATSWTGMQFDPNTADTNQPTNNVVLGSNPSSCSNSWTFSSSGNIGGLTPGEATDSDTGDAGLCNSGNGYLLWIDTPSGPTLDQVMRHGNWFSGGVEQSFTF